MNVLTRAKKVHLHLPVTEEFLAAGVLFLISRAPVMGMFPFGMAFWAAVLTQKGIYIGLAGLLLGVWSAGGEVLKYALAAGLYLIYTYFRKNKLLDSIFCGFFIFIAGMVSILFNSQSPVYIAVSAAEGILSALAFVIAARSESFYMSCKGVAKATQEEIISVVLFCGILLTGFSGIYIIENLHLCTLLGIYLILCLSRCTGIAAAGSMGLVLGFVCSMNTPSAVLVMGACGIGAVLSNLLKEFGKAGSVAGFFAGAAICAAYSGDFANPPVSLYEAGIGAVMFLTTPKSVFSKLESLMAKAVQNPAAGKEVRVKEYLSGELKQIAKAFTDLADGFLSLSRQSEVEQNASDMFDEVAERVCSECPKWGECWIDGFNEMYRKMFGILKVIETSGYCSLDNMPIVFKEKCIRAEVFLAEFNHLYELYKQNAMLHGEINLGQDMVARQYHEISNLIKGLSEEVESGFSFIESAELKLDSALERVGFFAKEINVIENSRREPEVYISAGFGAEPEILEKVVSEVLGMPMRLEDNSSSMKFVAHNRFFVEYAVCQHSGEAEQVCGDTVMQFETEDNKFCLLLCDGMGSGDNACEESRVTAGLFQDFIKAGFIKDTAVKMINSALAMKAGRESFSTIDLAEIDLRTGQAEFLKVGAAESYLKQKDGVEIISAKALPIGILEDIQTPAVTRNLNDGDIIVMASDGISETGYGVLKGAWLKQLILEHEGNMQELADKVLKNARQKAYPKPCDDMTVAAARLKKL